MRLARLGPVFLATSIAIATAHAAGCGSDTTASGFQNDDGGAADGTASDAPIIPDFDSSHGAAKSLVIDPADSVVDVTDLAALPKVTLKAKVTFADNTTETPPASWTLDRQDIAGIGAGTGLVTPTGATFGKAIVTAKALGLVATTSITIRLKASSNPGSVNATDQGKLAGATTPDPAVTQFAYPYDKTVFPRGLLPPEEMWNGGAAGDVYSVHFVAPSFDLTVLAKADPPSRFTLSKPMWNALTTTAAGVDVAIELRRLSGGNAYVSAHQSWKVADANLRGTIYYWAINQGQIVKIDLPTGQRSLVFDSGASGVLGTPAPLNAGSPRTPPWQDNGAGKRCVACHSVSKDGSKLMALFTRETSTGPVGFVDIASGQTQAIGNYETNSVYDALTPDGKLAVLNASAKTMQLVDSANAQPIASALDALADVCDPTFSPSGTSFALGTNCDPGFGYPVEFRRSDLTIYDFTQSTRTFSNPRTVLTSAGIGDAIAFPSFSPDSKWIFFQRGDYSRAKYGDAQNMKHGSDDLFVAAAQAGAQAIALDMANGKGVLPNDSAHLNYAPTVNPIAEGGYAWVVFTSPRDYGNRMVSPRGAPPSDATYANHKQLWVTAVDANVGSVDPSHPAFWLPGQDDASANMFGYWALAPCKATQGDAGGGGQSCSAGFECCSGFCRDTGSGPVCVDQPGGCHQLGEKCATSADCCNAGAGVACIAGVCQKTRVN